MAAIAISSVAALVAAGCVHATQPAEDPYYTLVDEAVRHFEDERPEGVRRVLAEISQLRVYDVPTYENYFFESYLAFLEGDLATGESKLNLFRDMLEVDAGNYQCGSGGEIIIDGRSVYRPVVFSEMCSEMFLGYYDQPSTEQQAYIDAHRERVARLQDRF